MNDLWKEGIGRSYIVGLSSILNGVIMHTSPHTNMDSKEFLLGAERSHVLCGADVAFVSPTFPFPYERGHG